ncbi:hypothetical protein ANCDUO_16964, partial [Ancylostoma duodenale]
LKCIGIENPEDLRSFLAVTEKDGNLITELCTLLKTDVLQIKSKIEDLQKVVSLRDEDEDMEEPSLLQDGEKGYGSTKAQALWRDRANAYARKDQQSSKSAGQQTGSPQHWNRTPWRPERSHEPEPERLRSTAPEQGRRCYHCSQYGHL